MAKLVAYYRVSSEGQRDNTSLESQRDQVVKHAALRGHEIIWHYSDIESASGRKKRISFDRAINAVETGGADGLICAKLDRFARNTVEGLQIAKRWHTLNKQLVVIDLNLDTTSPMGQAIFTVLLAFAELEREVINERTRTGRNKVKNKGGRASGGAPFGFTISRDSNNVPRLIPNPDEHSFLLKMHNWRNCGFTFQKIASMLNDLGSRTKYGRSWHSCTVRNVLSREFPGGISA